jgi:hypothetical protein
VGRDHRRLFGCPVRRPAPGDVLRRLSEAERAEIEAMQALVEQHDDYAKEVRRSS